MLRTALLTRFVLSALGAAVFFGQTASARAADETKDESSASDKGSADGDQASASQDKPAEAGIWATTEDPTKSYKYVGARYRHVIVPRSLLNLFVDGGALTHVPVAGLEFGMRRNRLEYIFSLSYGDYATGDLLFKAKTEPDTSYEMFNSDLGVIFAKVEILYEIPLDKKNRFALLIGGGVGIGGMIGDLYRAQAYPKNGTSADPNDLTQWGRCSSLGVPNIAYCSNNNQAFGSYSEPSWIGGGLKPIVLPWIALPQVSFRYKPFKFLQARVDAGLALSSGFYFGGSVDYIL